MYKEQFEAGKLGGTEAEFLSLLLPYDWSQWRAILLTLKMKKNNLSSTILQKSTQYVFSMDELSSQTKLKPNQVRLPHHSQYLVLFKFKLKSDKENN